jgi:acylphosphatase
MMRRARFLIKGHVQGVCYRMYAQEEADRIGLTGWVKNQPDSTVEVVCEGERSAIAAFLTWCRKGPVGARVTDIEVAYAEPTGEFDSFVIEYRMRW